MLVCVRASAQTHVYTHEEKNVEGCAYVNVHVNPHMRTRGHMHLGTKIYVSAQTKAHEYVYVHRVA